MRRSRTQETPIDARFIIPRSHHPVSKTDISQNALKVLNRLQGEGYQAYLVGGSVRDLMLRKKPKDFDISTNATPNQIRKLFRNARIIGRRFKLVHILFHREIIEVATFRGAQEEENADQRTNEHGMLVRDNVYGTLQDDVWRRDFTVNALYYNLKDSSVIDFTDAVKDIHLRQLRLLGEAEKRYQEDPVRMLRAIRFAAKLNFDIAPDTANPIFHMKHLLAGISSSRLFDEIVKLSLCGELNKAYDNLKKFGLLEILFPQAHQALESTFPVQNFLEAAFFNTDKRVQEDKPVTPAFFFATLLWFPLRILSQHIQHTENLPPLVALEKAMHEIILLQNKTIAIPKRFSQSMREIWLLQYLLPKRKGKKPFKLLEHPRFRAAYDFLTLRAQVKDAPASLAQWWSKFQDASEEVREKMCQEYNRRKTTKPSEK